LEKYREKFYIFYKAIIGPINPLNETSASPGNLRAGCHKSFMKLTITFA
jgi:hypothetical protein